MENVGDLRPIFHEQFLYSVPFIYSMPGAGIQFLQLRTMRSECQIFTPQFRHEAKSEKGEEGKEEEEATGRYI